ncbi:MAG: hypothetical protein K6G10_02745, partial [Butyrivibrio sp.]|nr:hypothetical protein [Butyrivibrio sp.]
TFPSFAEGESDILEAVGEVSQELEQAEAASEASSDSGLTQEMVEEYVATLEEVGNEYKQGENVPEDDVIMAVDAVYTKAIEFKDQGIVKNVVKRTSDVEITFINDFLYTWFAGNEPSEASLKDQEEKKVLQEEKQGQQLSQEESTRWSPADSKNKVQQFLIPVPSSTVRYEIFYTAGTELPQVTFTSTTEQYKLTAGVDQKEDGEDGFVFLTKQNLTLDEHDDFRYMTIYISNAKDPGKWLMTVNAPQSVTEVIAVSSAVPDNWETLNSDIITKPYGVIFWYIDSRTSKYREVPIATINDLIKSKSSLKPIDTVKDTTPEPVDYTSTYILLAVVGVVIVAALAAFLLIKANKKKDSEYRAKREAIVKKENEKLRKKKSQENDELDAYLDDYSDEYIDDEDMEGYLSMDDSGTDDEIFTDEFDMPMTEQDGEYEAAERAREKFNDDIPVKAPWMEEPKAPAFTSAQAPTVQKSVAEINSPAPAMAPISPAPSPAAPLPAWMTAENDDSDDFF